MKKNFKILIADRKRSVREFLRREIAAAGYEVQTAESGREVLERVYKDESIKLLILDPSLPDANEVSLIRRLKNRLPCLPVIIHAFLWDAGNISGIFKAEAVVEKGGGSVEHLKAAVCDFFKRSNSEQTNSDGQI